MISKIFKNKKIFWGVIVAVIFVGIQLISYRIDKINEENNLHLFNAMAINSYSLDSKIKANTALLRNVLVTEYNSTLREEDYNEALIYLQKQASSVPYCRSLEAGLIERDKDSEKNCNVTIDPGVIQSNILLLNEDLFGNGSTLGYYYSKELAGAISYKQLTTEVMLAANPKSDKGWKLFRGLLIATGLVITIYLILLKEGN